MSALDTDRIKSLGETGDGSCVPQLLEELLTARASIPPVAGELPGGSLDPVIATIESIASALAKVLERVGGELAKVELERCANVEDVRYTVSYYYPPGGIAESGELTVSLSTVRHLAQEALRLR